ncbi:MAG: YciI family protein [Thermoanaerobaculia bacterium]
MTHEDPAHEDPAREDARDDALVIMLPPAGFFAGRWSSPPPSAPEPSSIARYAGEWFSAPSAPEPRFALLLYGGPRASVPEEAHANAERYGAWAREPHPEGHVLGGKPLMPDARVVGLADGATLADAGPLRGFFLVDAVDLDAATELARGNPHLTAGGVIEVRPVGLPDRPPKRR